MGYQETKAFINANIKQNGENEITGSILNTALNDVLDSGHEEVNQLSQDLDELELNVAGIKEYDGGLSIGTLYPDGKVYPAHDTFRTTDYVFLKSGQRFVSTAVNEIVGAQSYPNMCVYSGPDVSGLISAISAQSAQGFEYTAIQDCYVRFSNSLEKWVAPNIVVDNSIESRLDVIEPQVADVASRLDSMKVYENVVPYSGNENVGALHNDGKIYPEHTTFRTSDFIQLKRGMSLYSTQKNELVNVQTYPNLCVYSSANENSFIAGVYATQQYGFEYTATQDCYVRFTNLKDYFSFDISDILTPIVHPIEIWVKELYKQGMVLKGKKIGFLGDSITEYGQYTSAFAEKTGANVVNYGVAGTTIANSSAGQSFIQRVAQMDNDLDIVVVFGGVNDQRLPVPLGTFENRNADGSLDSTFYGALHTLCRSLFAKYAGKPIIFITPMHNSYRDETYGDTGDINYYEYTTNGLIVENKFPLREKTYIDNSIAVGDVLSKYRKAIIDVCELYSFPVIDMYAISGLFPIIEQNSQLYTLDGIHPNTFGGNHIADLMIPKIIELLNP